MSRGPQRVRSSPSCSFSSGADSQAVSSLLPMGSLPREGGESHGVGRASIRCDLSTGQRTAIAARVQGAINTRVGLPKNAPAWVIEQKLKTKFARDAVAALDFVDEALLSRGAGR